MIYPKDPSEYIERGNTKFKTNDFKGAIEEYTEALKLVPNNKNLYWKRGVSKSRLLDIKGSQNDFIKYEELDDLDLLKERISNQKRSECRLKIETHLGQLNPRERKVLRLRFGLDDGEFRTLKEIGKFFALTGERIRQIESKALKKLRVIAAMSSVIETKLLENK